MTITMGSMFRNSTGYLSRYFAQAMQLRTALEHRGAKMRLVLVEGDSTDDTWVKLAEQTEWWDAVLVKRAHGGPRWGSVDDPARWRALSWVCNGVMEHLGTDTDALIYVESDLSWDAETMVALLDRLDNEHPAMSPMSFAENGNFYDIWGYRKNGCGFSMHAPYHPELNGITQIDSAGSCIVMRGDVAKQARFGPHDCVLGLGRSIYQAGFSLWVDPTLRVVQV
jgi:hypothetical protein